MRYRALALVVAVAGSALFGVPSAEAHPASTTLTVTSSARGTFTATAIDGSDDVINCGSDCTATYVPTEECIDDPEGPDMCIYVHPTIELTATATGGWAFQAWTGACAGEASTTCTLDMELDRAVGATFTDPSAPGVTMSAVTSPANGTIVLGATASDSQSGVTRVDFHVGAAGGGLSLVGSDTSPPYQFGWDSTSHPDGSYQARATAFNGVGATTNSSVVPFIVDNTLPTLTITSGPAAGSRSRNTSPSFTFTTDEGLDSVACQVFPSSDPSSTTGLSCAPGTPFVVPDLTDGGWVLDITGIDEAGNSRTLLRSWTVDTTAPSTKLLSGPKRRTTSRKATFKFTSNEAGSKFQCKLDGGKYRSCSSPKTYRRLKRGRHTVRIRAIDLAGNADPTPVVRSWRVVRAA